MRLHRHVPQKLEPRPHTGRTGRAPALILHAMRSLGSTKWGIWDHHHFPLERVAPTDMDVHRARQTPCHQTHRSWAPDARTGEVAWQLLPFLCVPFYLHFLCALSTCRSNPRRDPSVNLNQEVRVTTPRVQKRLLPSAQAQDTYPVSQQRCSVPVGEALGPAGLGYWEVGRMGERVGGRGRTAAHHLQIPLTKQPNVNLRKQGVQQKENKPKMGLGG